MAAFSTKGLTVWLQKKPGSSPPPIPITSATNAKPSVVTVAAGNIDDFAEGDLVTMNGTGNAALDGQTFPAVNITGNTFTLLGSDGSGAPASATTGTATNITADMVEFCVANLDRQQTPAQAISVGTTCDPSAQIAGEPQAGTLAVTGFVDYQKEGFLEFMQAVDDQLPRLLEIKLPEAAVPSGNGAIIFPSVTATGFSESFAVGAAAGFTGEFTLGTRPVYRIS